MEKEFEASQDQNIYSDKIDYSNALIREFGRSQASDEIRRLNSDSQVGVLTDFAKDKLITNGKNNDIVFDVLPSFQLYSSLQHPSNESSNFPPDYSPSISSFPSISRASTSTNSETRSDLISDSTSLPNEPFIEDDFFNKNLIDNLNKLPKKINHALDIQIHITKNVPVPNQPYEPESALKEYTSGDIVNGYIDIVNKSKVPIPFQAFYVTLQGYISVVDVENKKQILKPLINMVDLSACWTLSCISPSGNINYEPLSKDFDGAQLGLTAERIILPQQKARKFFTFKFPYNTLDTCCRHQQELHTLLPPSFGLDALHGFNANIEIDKTLNFGRIPKLGSPILTKDLSTKKLSINYSINATMCDIKPINNSKKMVIIQQNEHALRFIPFGFGVSLFSSRNAINQLKGSIRSNLKNAERCLKLLNNEDLEIDNQIKLQQISLSSKDNLNFPLRNKTNPDFSKIETGLTFNSNDSSKKLLSFKSNKLSNGFLSISTSTQKDGLPYISPSLIRKVNEATQLTALGFENLKGLDNVLTTNEKKKLDNLKINFNFNPSDFNNDVINLPKLNNVEVSLLIVNTSSISSIPIKLSADVCDPSEFNHFQKEFIEFNDELINLEAEFKKVGKDIEEYIHKDVLSDIKAMKSMKNESFEVDVFKSNIHSESDWENVNNSYSKNLEINLEFLNNIKETLIPSFQTCLISRTYFIQVKFFFGKQSTYLRIPIRLRNLVGLS